jgi:hypothetical protein
MFAEEGIINTVKILWNIFSHEPSRKRVLAMRSVFQKYHPELGYIILCATA